MRFLIASLIALSGCIANKCKETAFIGPEGGALGCDDATLIVPPNALTQPTELSVEEIDPVGDVLSEISKAYRFGPVGLHLARPAYVTIRLTTPERDALLAFSKENGVGWDLGATLVTPIQVMAPVEHLGTGFITPRPGCDYAMGAGIDFSIMPGSGHPTAILAGDFNNDGKTDVLAGTDTGSLQLFRGNGDKTLQSPVEIAKSVAAVREAAAMTRHIDTSGLKKYALALREQDGAQTAAALSLLLLSADGTVESKIKIADRTDLPEAPHTLATGDLDGDGLDDLIVASLNNIEAYRLLAGGTLAPPVVIAQPQAGQTFIGVRAEDINFDFRPDVVALSNGPTSSTVYNLQNVGPLTFAPPRTQVGPAGATDLATFPLYPTGRRDVAVASGSGVDLFVGTGDGTLLPAVKSPAAGTEPSDVIEPAAPGPHENGIRRADTSSWSEIRLLHADCNGGKWASVLHSFDKDGRPIELVQPIQRPLSDPVPGPVQVELPSFDFQALHGTAFDPLMVVTPTATTQFPENVHIELPANLFKSVDLDRDGVPENVVAGPSGLHVQPGVCTAPQPMPDMAQPDTDMPPPPDMTSTPADMTTVTPGAQVVACPALPATFMELQSNFQPALVCIGGTTCRVTNDIDTSIPLKASQCAGPTLDHRVVLLNRAPALTATMGNGWKMHYSPTGVDSFGNSTVARVDTDEMMIVQRSSDRARFRIEYKPTLTGVEVKSVTPFTVAHPAWGAEFDCLDTPRTFSTFTTIGVAQLYARVCYEDVELSCKVHGDIAATPESEICSSTDYMLAFFFLTDTSEPLVRAGHPSQGNWVIESASSGAIDVGMRHLDGFATGVDVTIVTARNAANRYQTVFQWTGSAFIIKSITRM